MKPLLYIVLDDMSGDDVHIANASGLSGGAAITLCGFVDVPYEDAPDDAKATCGECLAIVRYCKSVRL